MAITIRVPDPAEKYEVGNQRQIVRAINNVIQQLNAQYKPEGETFSEIEQLSYFLGYAPSTPSGPAKAATCNIAKSLVASSDSNATSDAASKTSSSTTSAPASETM